MNIPDISEVDGKLRRIRAHFDTAGYEAMIIGRQDNFAWLTCGGNNRVVITSETGVTLLVVTTDKVYAVAQVMDCARVMEEELAGLGIEAVPLCWYEASREEKAVALVNGKKTISDIPVKGADFLPNAIYSLHYPLTEKELDRCRQLGRTTEGIIRKIADALKPGMSEQEASAMLNYEYTMNDVTPEVLLVASDERIAKFRHPNPTGKKIGKLLLLHPAVNWRGLHANVTRMVSFGEPNADIMRRFGAVSTIEAVTMSMCIPGAKYKDLLEMQKGLYARFGFTEEWRNHYQGAATGYYLSNTEFYKHPEAVIGPNQAWDLFITITGVKVEELGLNTMNGFEIPSVSGKWPVKEYEWNGQSIRLPDILVK